MTLHPMLILLCLGLSGWTSAAGAQLFSSTGPVIAIFAGSLLVGEATGHLGGWGTLALRSPSKPELTCVGEFSTTDGLGDGGQLRCSDGTSAPFRFQRLTLMRGYGVGNSSASSLSFTYGLSAEESISYLKVPPGKELRRQGNNLELIAAVPFPMR